MRGMVGCKNGKADRHHWSHVTIKRSHVTCLHSFRMKLRVPYKQQLQEPAGGKMLLIKIKSR